MLLNKIWFTLTIKKLKTIHFTFYFQRFDSFSDTEKKALTYYGFMRIKNAKFKTLGIIMNQAVLSFLVVVADV